MHSATFRSEFRKGIYQARRDGELNLRQHARLWLASFNDDTLDKIEELIVGEANHRGMRMPMSADGSGAPDWTAFFEQLLSFFKSLIPLILQLVELFK